MSKIMIAVLLAAAGPAAAAGPTQTIQTAVQQVFSQPDGSAVKTISTAQRRADVRKVAEGLFDFNEMSERALGAAWGQASPGERQEFVRLFTTLIATAYMSKIEQYTGEPIRYVSERVDGDEAAVLTRVVTPKGSEIGIEYRMYLADGRWTVYDIRVDGISLASSYRSQFNRIIKRGSFAELLEQLRDKVGS